MPPLSHTHTHTHTHKITHTQTHHTTEVSTTTSATGHELQPSLITSADNEQTTESETQTEMETETEGEPTESMELDGDGVTAGRSEGERTDFDDREVSHSDSSTQRDGEVHVVQGPSSDHVDQGCLSLSEPGMMPLT